MSNELIFATQIGTFIGFVLALFVLYRVLVGQKDATIQLLKEKIGYLDTQLAEVKNQEPDVLVQRISARVTVLTEELERLNKDKEANESEIAIKEKAIAKATRELQTLRAQMKRAEELMSEFFCPKCKAPMLSREFHWESRHYQGREIDVDHEHVVYECGLELVDGEEQSACGSL